MFFIDSGGIIIALDVQRGAPSRPSCFFCRKTFSAPLLWQWTCGATPRGPGQPGEALRKKSVRASRLLPIAQFSVICRLLAVVFFSVLIPRIRDTHVALSHSASFWLWFQAIRSRILSDGQSRRKRPQFTTAGVAYQRCPLEWQKLWFFSSICFLLKREPNHTTKVLIFILFQCG